MIKVEHITILMFIVVNICYCCIKDSFKQKDILSCEGKKQWIKKWYQKSYMLLLWWLNQH